MLPSPLPEAGPVRLGPVSLPAGRRVAAVERDDQPVAWVTTVDVPDPGRAWSALSGLREDTGLVPVLLDGEEDEEDYFFARPADIGEINRLDPAALLTALWQDSHEDTSGPAPMWDAPLSKEFLGLDNPPPGGYGLGDIATAFIGMMSDPAAEEEFQRLNEIDRRNAGQQPAQPDEPGQGEEPQPFPGLTPPARRSLSRAERDTVLASLPPARIALVPATRPADVPAVVGGYRAQPPFLGAESGRGA